MRCPKCQAEDAYVGFSKIECVNFACEHFSSDWREHMFSNEREDEDVIQSWGLKCNFPWNED